MCTTSDGRFQGQVQLEHRGLQQAARQAPGVPGTL